MKNTCWFCEEVLLKKSHSPITHYFVSYNYEAIHHICNGCLDFDTSKIIRQHHKIFNNLEDAQEHLIHIKLFGPPNENKSNKFKNNPI